MEEEKKNRVKQPFWKQLLGYLAILVGAFGVIFPIIPGWLLIFLGLELIGINFLFKEEIEAFIFKRLLKSKKSKRR